ncbi:MAG: DNA-directed RNA polymerase subunit alpha [Candidatus Gottesmanbacteria bacterium GW2011_GWA2_41_12]|uniref:DNA-directed RNA polymerase subunit alpha n=1 Tax=Candidatus Gottesmanbacteria bacterium GW2011_GWA2_41_12 TaxID=1618440 RepID=A0A0G0WVP0_9BACT|nr:MAG: DNA-directed RNA polymerase subunit alpha [Candidatus Gottesmanbacteria bacterium GW2011_GWA2_41_12]
MIEPNFEIKRELEEGNYGKFALEPLEQGYGYTLGTSLRRVLLTSLRGASVTEVKISGVKHQFATVAGMKEDVIDLILNIKNIRLKVHGDKPVNIRLSAKGPKKVTARDIETTSEVEIVNKDLYLCELTAAKSKLDIEMKVESGLGYVSADEKQSDSLGTIMTDALFTPVVRVNTKVEATRVGRMTNLDRLVLEIWTDGTIAPYEALKESARICMSYFLQIFEPKALAAKEVAVTPSVSDEILKMTLEELDLPTRIVNALHNGGIDTVGQLLGTERKELLKIKNLGIKSISVVDDKLRERGVALNV